MIDNDDIKRIVEARFNDSKSAELVIRKERIDAIDRYNAELYGDEVSGLSKFTTSDVRDTIEWMLPQLIEMFIGDEPPVEFAPKNAEDVEQAKIETDYCRHVYGEQNDGFGNTYALLKDGLLLKNGFVKVFWDENVQEKQETYDDIDYGQYIKLTQDAQIEITETTVKIGEQEMTLEEAMLLPPEAAMVAKFDVVAIRKEDNSQVIVDVLPPENCYVEAGLNTINLDEANYFCHKDVVTKNDLLIDGYKRSLIDTIPLYNDADEEKQNRFEKETVNDSYHDDLSQKVTVFEHYIRADLDGSGKAKLWMVKTAGDSNAIVLDTEEIDKIPVIAWTPVINTHKFYGMSIADLVKDVQALRTTLWRQMLNNLYLTNNPRKIYLDGKVNKADLLNSSSGALVRATQLDAVQDLVVPFVADKTFPVLSLVDEMRQERTGVSSAAQGLDPKVLADSTNLVGSMVMTQAMQRIKMVGRIFAETAFKRIMRSIQELCAKHDSERTFPRNGEFSKINPREWSRRTSLICKVGVGHVDKIARINAVTSILGYQQQLVAAGGLESPLMSAQALHEALVEHAKLVGYPDGAKFYRDPTTYQEQPKQDVASEALQIEEARTIADVQKQAAKNALDAKMHTDEMALKEKELAMKMDLELRKLEQEKDLFREEMLLKYANEISKGASSVVQNNS